MGIPALIVSHIAGKEQQGRIDAQYERSLLLERDLAEAKINQAEAELQLAEVRKRQEPRRLIWDKFVEPLKSGPKGTAIIMYQPDDSEAHALSSEMWMALGSTGWRVSEPIPIPSDAVIGTLRDASPVLINRLTRVERVGGSAGVTIVANNLDEPMLTNRPDTAYLALETALLGGLGGTRSTLDASLADSVFRVIVGSRP